MGLRLIAWGGLLAVLCFSSGCELLSSTCDETDEECLGRDVRGRRAGTECERTLQCAVGLTCQDGTCAPSGDVAEGETCRRSAECEDGLYCDLSRTCAPAGEGDVGALCTDSGDCVQGLRCDISSRGLPLRCAETGDKDIGQACAGNECMAGLTCVPLLDPPTCQSPPGLEQEVPSVPSWDGVECPSEAKSPVAYFDVPGSGKDSDFYRLPFPNDIRVRSGKVDLSDHPRPPEQPIPIASRFIDAADGSLSGFSTNPVVYFRFSEKVDFDSVKIEGARILVDITPGSPTYERREKPEAWPTTDSRYICDNWLAFRREIGRPLRPGTTYAVVLTTAVKPAGGGSFERAPDFEAMLANATPSDADLARAHKAYAPLRAWIEDNNVPDSEILAAAVFTTMAPEAHVAALADAIDDRDAPSVRDLTLCKSGVKSPCETMELEEGQSEPVVRGACAGGKGFAEIHGRIRLPIFQEGELPYEETGGDIPLSDGGAVKVQGTEDVCFALSVPDGDMPSDGWPVLIYAHGTGGSFAGTMGPDGLAEDMAGADQPAAMLAIDMPQHGARRGDSKLSPEVLFFNIINPEAARGNVLQGAADLLSLVAFVKGEGVSAGDSPTGDAVAFDTSRIAVMGHSQGATHAALALPYATGVAAGVLSGVGGHLGASLLSKTEPLPVADVLGFALYDASSPTDSALSGDARNPALAIIQWFNEPADPINFAWRIRKEPTARTPEGMHLFMTYGRHDNYAPEATQTAYARAGDFPQVGPAMTDLNLDVVSAPASNTVTVGGVERTVAVRQYSPVGDVDGHFVAVRNGQPGRPDVFAFLEAVMAGETPAIGR